MPAPRKTLRKAKEDDGALTPATLDAYLTQYADTVRMASAFSKTQSDMKAELKKFVSEHGYTDEKGNLWFDLDEPVAGFEALKVERRVTKTFNVSRAEEWATPREDLNDKVWEVVETVTEDLVLAAQFEGYVDEEELQALYDVSETFAFVPTKERQQ